MSKLPAPIADSYRLLDVAPGADLTQVRSAYRVLVKVWHPDRHGSDPDLQRVASSKLAAINHAYDLICRFLASTLRFTPAPDEEVDTSAAASGLQDDVRTVAEGNVRRLLNPAEGKHSFKDAESTQLQYDTRVISETNGVRIEEHIDGVGDRHCFTETRFTSHRSDRGLQFEYVTRVTVWLSLAATPWLSSAASLEASKNVSMAFRDGLNWYPFRGWHYDGLYSGYAWDYKFPDGSAATQGVKPDGRVVTYQALLKKRCFEPALLLAQALRMTHPSAAWGYVYTAYCLHALRRTEAARDELMSIADTFPGVGTIPYNLACYECALGHAEEAKKWLKRAKSIDGKDSVRRRALADPDLRPLTDYVQSLIWW